MVGGIWAVLAAAWLVRAATWATPDRVTAWAARRGIDPKRTDLELLARSLTTTRVCRTSGVLFALAAADHVQSWTSAWLSAFGHDLARAMHDQVTDTAWATIALIGYAIGIGAAQVVLSNPTSSSRTARLTPRTADGYRAGPSRAVLLTATAVLAVAVAVHRLAQGQAVVTTGELIGSGVASVRVTGSDDLASVAIRPLLALAIVSLLGLIRRIVVLRPQRAMDDAQAAADDAVRVADVHALVGCQVYVVLGAAAGALIQAAEMVDGAGWLPVLYGLAIACGAGALAALVWFGPGGPFRGGAGRRAERVRSPLTPPPPVAPLATEQAAAGRSDAQARSGLSTVPPPPP